MQQLILILTLLSAGQLSWAKTCAPVDLRDPKVAPERSQLYTDNGKLKDSRYCYAFAIANLVGQRLSTSISPEYIAIAYARTWTYPFDVFPLKFGHGGNLSEAFTRLSNSGYCRSENFSNYLQSIDGLGSHWYQALNQAEAEHGFAAVSDRSQRYCTPLLTLSPSVKLKEFVFNFSVATREEAMRNASVLLGEIDKALDSKKFVNLSYELHEVTVVGRTESCHYLIQDSLPDSYRKREDYVNLYHTTLSEHIQVWSEPALLEALKTPAGLEGGYFPVIRYLVD